MTTKSLKITCKQCGSKVKMIFNTELYACLDCDNDEVITVAMALNGTYNQELFDVELVVEK
jgi:predicted nucleic-acid-binding Zn-ribbon protein